jgi:Na+-driven multidrug efflux pump
LINSYGAQATAAYGAVIQVITYVHMPAISLGMAIGIFGSQLIGARATQRLGSLLKNAIMLNYVIGAVLVGIVYLFREPILALFLTEGTTLEMAERILLLVLWSYMLFGHGMVISGLMRASGTVLWPTLIGIFAVWGVQVPVAYLLSEGLGWGLDGVWLAYPVAFLFSLTAEYVYYRVSWKKKKHDVIFNEPARD